MNGREIAVIGMSGVYPLADTVLEFYQNLLEGRDCIHKVPQSRLELTKQNPDKSYLEFGYLDKIDEFDYEFFNLSYKEACYMDPQQRLALQEACKTIWNSGYSLEQFRGTKTAVILGCGDSEYKSLTNEESGAVKIGNLKSVIAGRISYQLNLKGLAYVLDTSCSSSLMAIHQGCNHLRNEEADYVLAGGVSLNVPIVEDDMGKINQLGIGSSTCRTRTFDADSDGTGGGEGCSFVLLKRLEDAVRDQDHIYAVIKGSSANQDGGTSSSVAAPSPSAQTEVILDAWKKAGVNPETITYLEAHGTGTKIGDPIEVQALTDAFSRFTTKKGFCEISAVKSNIGHTGYHAGIASFIKAVLAVYYKKKLPLIHFKKANPMIQFKDSAVTPCVKTSDWKDIHRRAGISSFGLSGTNVHIVIEQAPESIRKKHASQITVPFVLSAKSEAQVMEYAKEYAIWLEKTEWELYDIAYTQYIARERYPYTRTLWVSSKQELIEQLKQMEAPVYTKAKEEVILLCSGDTQYEEEVIKKWITAHKESEIAAYLNGKEELLQNRNVSTVVGQVIAYTEWKNRVPVKTIVGCGLGNLTVAYALKKQTIRDTIERASKYQESAPLNQEAFLKAMNQLASVKVLFVELGQRGMLSKLIKDNVLQSNVLCCGVDRMKVLREAMEQGLNIPWKSMLPEGNKVPVYPYLFATRKCWLDVIKVEQDVDCIQQKKIETKIEVPTRELIRDIWKEVLGFEEFTDEEDFFEIGGNSLMAMQIIDRLVEERQVELEFDDLYDFNTVKKLTEYVEQQEAARHLEMGEQAEKTNGQIQAELSYQQESMLILYKQNKKSTAYNMPALIRVKGCVDKEALFAAMNKVLEKHDVLRTIYREEQGIYKPCVLESAKLSVSYEDFFGHPDKEKLWKKRREDMVETVFSLEEEIPIKMHLVRTEPEEYLLFLVIHHIAADGWSVGIIFQEFAEHYAAICKGKSVEIQKPELSYIQYAAKNKAMLQSEAGVEKLNYWLNSLKEIPDYLDFPTDKPRPEIMMNYGYSYTHTFSKEARIKMDQFCKEQGITNFVFLYSIYALLLYRYSGQSNFCIGTPVANRRGVQEEKIVGFFANSLAIHETIDGTQTFIDYVTEKKKQLTTALRNQDIPFDYIAKHLKVNRSMSHTPVFQYGFVLQNLGNQFKLDQLETEFMELPVQYTKFEMLMSLSLNEEEFEVKMEYASELFYYETIRDFVTAFENLLINSTQEPAEELDQLSIWNMEKDSCEGSLEETSEDYDF